MGCCSSLSYLKDLELSVRPLKMDASQHIATTIIIIMGIVTDVIIHDHVL